MMLLDLAHEQRIETAALPNLGDAIPCEMADPVSYSADGSRVEEFADCRVAASWRLVLRWHHGSAGLDEHLLCDRHLGVWQAFRAANDPPWDIALLAKL